jgi:AcrR family transcriptional regulator
MDTRQKILDVARQEFGSLGLDGARVDRIARRAHVNKAMIYYHFRSKEKLYEAVIDGHMEKVGVFFEKNVTEDTDFETFIVKVAAFYNVMIQENPSFVPLILREIALGGERMKAALTRVIVGKGIGKRLEKLITAGIASGQFRPVDTKQAIVSFWGMNMFYLIMAPVVNSVWEIENVNSFRENRPKEVVDLFLYGLKAR